MVADRTIARGHANDEADEPRWGRCSIAAARAALTAAERRFVTVASITIAIVVITQKIAIGANIELGVAAVWPFTIWAFARGYSRIRPVRAVVYLLVVSAMTLASIIDSSNAGFSVTSPLFLIGLYLPFIFAADVRRFVYLAFAGNFQRLVLFIGAMVFFQWAQQAAGLDMFSIERFVPEKFLFPGFNYIQLVNYASRWYKPNAVFMLETSHTSQLLAIAIVVETVLFRRLWALLWLLVALMMTFGGTGTLMIVLSLPVLIFYLNRRIVISALVAAPIAVGVAVRLGFLANALGRTQEFNKAGSSGSGRFIAPFQIMRDTIEHLPRTALFGIGAGITSPYQYTMYDTINPIAKTILEYGVVAGLAWLIWFHATLFSSRAPFAIAWVVLLQFDFMGGSLLIPVQVYYCLFLCAMMVPARRTVRASAPPLLSARATLRRDRREIGR